MYYFISDLSAVFKSYMLVFIIFLQPANSGSMLSSLETSLTTSRWSYLYSLLNFCGHSHVPLVETAGYLSVRNCCNSLWTKAKFLHLGHDSQPQISQERSTTLRLENTGLCILTWVCHHEFMIDIWRTTAEVIFPPLYRLLHICYI